MLTGKHLIAGAWVDGTSTFVSSPATGPAHTFAAGTATDIAKAAEAAEAAFASFSQTRRAERAAFLDRIADEIEARAEQITEIGCQETALPEVRLNGERGRTVGQLRMFARHIESGNYLDVRHDPALPKREPLPRADLRLMQRPLGPVAVFGASNFPLAFSVAGGDTASALAAGCPVVVKGHSAHPGTGELVAQAIDAAIKACNLHPGVFSFVQGGNRDAGTALVQHPNIKAVGFTGSLGGGRALFDLCAQRPEPIPFFGELGSVNPMFILPRAASSRAAVIGAGWAGSLTLGAGQFCTNPGIAVIIKSPDSQTFIDAAHQALSAVATQTMLTDGIAEAYDKGVNQLRSVGGVESKLSGGSVQRDATPTLFITSGANWLAHEELSEEIFGPAGLVVEVADFEEMQAIARKMQGQLTCTLQLEEDDREHGKVLLPLLERKAGRILANAFPTGVEVCDTMVHGGPYPASTNFGATSVGTMAIRRFLRPVCYQDIPVSLLPEDLQ
ncbi:aldehyde dehydrogenase (NADP(+)) [Aestuariicella hydrocarbonica]|uniref:Aldehyde dehydrogenase (NADP(+)) n=1 Tax=Pseudomaricurvus hydrocarbonicus TaxID=1470433 RepID=A0A9E5JVF8_9GAMM|nr:aldehyde dehydrogenase (NADP(+)) [Aestuariicella hydrocarbonica]NHO65620.1 aldehyde dehydrogenase (NADP(+)) [Aestuariicella hydrocarbonica]